MSLRPFDQIEAMMRGEYVETGGLHFVATPDTKELMISVKDRVQHILDTAHEANPEIYKKRTITFQVLPEYQQFANKESIADIGDSVRGKHVYYFSDPHGDSKSISPESLTSEERSLNDKYTHDKLALGAFKDHSASSVNIVLQCMPYARQDKTTPGKRQANSMDIIGAELSGITGENGYVLTTDIHNSASKSSFQGTNFINLYSGWFVKRVIDDAKDNGEKLDVRLSPADQGGYTKISRIAEDYKLKNIIALKTRDYSTKNKVEDIQVIGDIEGKDVIIHDDILDTGGTLVALLEKILEKNPKSVRIVITHGLFNKEAFAKISNMVIRSKGVIKKVYITDSVNKDIAGKEDWIEKVSTADILANNILSIFQGFSVRRGNDKNYSDYDPKKKTWKGKKQKKKKKKKS